MPMRAVEIIARKRDGLELADEDIRALVDGYTTGNVPDYQMAAFAMAVLFRGMTAHETAVLLDGEFGFRQYLTASGSNTPISYFKAYTGIVGLLTPHFSTLARVGFGMDITTQSFVSVVGQLEGAYLANETASVRLGVVRDFQPISAPFVSAEDDRGYLTGKLLLFDKLSLSSTLSADYLRFLQTAGAARTDLAFALQFRADLEVTSWFTIALADQLSTRSTSLSALQDPSLGGIALTSNSTTLTLEFQY